MNSKLRIVGVETTSNNQSLLVTWSDGSTLDVNLAEHIGAYEVLVPLDNASLFEQVQVGEWGFDVGWPGDIQVPATTLYRLGMEQAGEAMPKSAFKEWMQRHGLSLTSAAEALHLTRRTITAYSSGPNPIPYHIALACKGWEVIQGMALHTGVSESTRGRYDVVPIDAKAVKPSGGKSRSSAKSKPGE